MRRLLVRLRRALRYEPPFHDTITVHVSPYGTCYVDVLDLIIPPAEQARLAREAIERYREGLS